MKILLVDDDTSITNVLSKFLSNKGHECIVSNDGKEGMLMCLKKKFDAIILDMMMPYFNGIDFINSLTERRKLEEQKIIVLTALDNHYTHQKENSNGRGIVASFQKPVELAKILKAIEA